LLRQARLDRVGDTFVLIGNDGTTVRWAALSSAGVLGTERALALPADATSPRFALAGVAAPGDRVVVAYLITAANGVDTELHAVAAPIDGSVGGAPGPSLVTFPDGAITTPMVEMGSSRAGMVAGLAWYDAPGAAISASLPWMGRGRRPVIPGSANRPIRSPASPSPTARTI
jgi:hypothetical protein